jgi:zinc protease
MVCDSKAEGAHGEALLANIFNRKAGGISIIGWKHEIESIEPKDLLDFHDRWFAPNNATLIIMGDIDTARVKILAEKYFGGIKTKKTSNPSDSYGTRPTGTKIICHKSPRLSTAAGVDYVYYVPFSHKDNLRKSISLALALGVLNSPAFFLRKSLEQAMSAAAYVNISYIFGMMQYDIVVVHFDCSSLDQMIEAERLWSYLNDKISHIAISDDELKAAKRRELLSLANRKDDMREMSKYFGLMLLFGHSPEEIFGVDDVVQSIAVKECMDVLASVFSSPPIAIAKAEREGYDRE